MLKKHLNEDEFKVWSNAFGWNSYRIGTEEYKLYNYVRDKCKNEYEKAYELLVALGFKLRDDPGYFKYLSYINEEDIISKEHYEFLRELDKDIFDLYIQFNKLYSIKSFKNTL